MQYPVCLSSLWPLFLDIKAFTFFCILLVTEALLRCRVVVVEKLKNCRVPSSTQDTHRGFKTNSGWKSEQGRHLFHFLTLNARHRQFVSSVHCPKNNLNLRQKKTSLFQIERMQQSMSGICARHLPSHLIPPRQTQVLCKLSVYFWDSVVNNYALC